MHVHVLLLVHAVAVAGLVVVQFDLAASATVHDQQTDCLLAEAAPLEKSVFVSVVLVVDQHLLKLVDLLAWLAAVSDWPPEIDLVAEHPCFA